jgi:hypothetical protein
MMASARAAFRRKPPPEQRRGAPVQSPGGDKNNPADLSQFPEDFEPSGGLFERGAHTGCRGRSTIPNSAMHSPLLPTLGCKSSSIWLCLQRNDWGQATDFGPPIAASTTAPERWTCCADSELARTNAGYAYVYAVALNSGRCVRTGNGTAQWTRSAASSSCNWSLSFFRVPSPWPSGYPDKAVTAFLLTALFGLLWANAGSEAMVLAIGFGMIFFIASPSPR